MIFNDIISVVIFAITAWTAIRILSMSSTIDTNCKNTENVSMILFREEERLQNEHDKSVTQYRIIKRELARGCRKVDIAKQMDMSVSQLDKLIALGDKCGWRF